MSFCQPVSEIIPRRFSCRTFSLEPVALDVQHALAAVMDALSLGPFGVPLRFSLVAAQEQDRLELRGLGTYGFIKGAGGFLAGVVYPGPMYLEDFGYRMEQVILHATDLGLGTCWLGGTFSKSSFARKIALSRPERIPAAVAIGNIPDEEQARQAFLRRQIGSHSRLPWESLFFADLFGTPLARQKAQPYALPLEMVRLAPSASNKQPWRVVLSGDAFHFYLHRTRGYREGLKLVGLEDLQRVDQGIAMCHFELTAREAGLHGRWIIQEPTLRKPDPLTEYTASWIKTID
ncbi:MAG: nitroreductase [Chloroflexi bacterium]|nr:MAG: nitroreductase [Chloroflexota bacterium]